MSLLMIEDLSLFQEITNWDKNDVKGGISFTLSPEVLSLLDFPSIVLSLNTGVTNSSTSSSSSTIDGKTTTAEAVATSSDSSSFLSTSTSVMSSS